MTDKEIIKALELFEILVCDTNAQRETICSALDLINRQEEMIDGLIAGQETLQKALAEKNAEIERLEKQLNSKYKWENMLDKKIKEVKAEAIKEFAKAYKDQIKNYTGMFTDEGFYVSLDAVLSAVDFVLNKTLEEMVEKNNG